MECVDWVGVEGRGREGVELCSVGGWEWRGVGTVECGECSVLYV